MEDVYVARIERLREAMRAARVRALWVHPSFDLRYLTGLAPLSMERVMGLLVPLDGQLQMVVPSMLLQESQHVADCRFLDWDDTQGPEGALKEALEGVGAVHVSEMLPFGVVQQMRSARPSIDVEIDHGTVAGLRARKDAAEAEALREAARVTDEMVMWVASQDVSSMTEIELARRISLRYQELGHHPWEELLVASGANASMPHYAGGDVPIDSSQPLLIDIGASVNGYQSDTTRVIFPNELAAEVETAYEVILTAAAAAFEVAAIGTPAQDVDRAARSVIAEAGYGEYFIHRTGHGVGLDIHEHPYIREGNEDPLQAGNCFSIEPGIYVPGRFGLRYENLVLLTDQGAEALNKTPARLTFPVS
jgi:Xaa-Pro aminopeptidase